MKLLIRKQIILAGLLAVLSTCIAAQDGSEAPPVLNGVSIPSDFPQFVPSIADETAPGDIFLTNRGGTPYLLIYNNEASPVFYQRLKDHSLDFRVQSNGMLSRWIEEDVLGYVVMNKHFQDLDTLRCQNGFETDSHELQLLPNGHALLIAREEKSLSLIYPEANPEAIVIGNHIQEIDENGNLVFQWLCWDHINLEDSYIDYLENFRVDYVHMNSIALDYDGHLVISSRSLSECTKINRQTGEIIWRLGGKNNQFEFINDPEQFSTQHDFRPVPGKANHYTLFDNGSLKNPKYSRALEFKLDTVNMLAEKVWEYRPSPDRYSRLMGNAQRLPNGNTLINWGDPTLPKITEVTPDSTVVYEADFTPKMNNYRTYRFDYEFLMLSPYLIAEPYPNKVRLIFNKFGDQGVDYYNIYGGDSPEDVEWIDSTSQTWTDLSDLDDSVYFYLEVTAVDTSGLESPASNQEKVFVRKSLPGDNLVINGDFSEGAYFWTHQNQGEGDSYGSVSDSVYRFNIENSGQASSDVQVYQSDIPLIQGKQYILELDARADSPRMLGIELERDGTPLSNYSRHGQTYITPEFSHIEHVFTMEKSNDLKSRLVINGGEYDIDFEIKNISLRQLVVSGITQGEGNEQGIKCYPNPVSKTLHVEYQLETSSHIKLELFNQKGQLIESLFHGRKTPGHHEITFDTGKLATGAYMLRLSDGVQNYSSIVLVQH